MDILVILSVDGVIHTKKSPEHWVRRNNLLPFVKAVSDFNRFDLCYANQKPNYPQASSSTDTNVSLPNELDISVGPLHTVLTDEDIYNIALPEQTLNKPERHHSKVGPSHKPLGPFFQDNPQQRFSHSKVSQAIESRGHAFNKTILIDSKDRPYFQHFKLSANTISLPPIPGRYNPVLDMSYEKVVGYFDFLVREMECCSVDVPKFLKECPFDSFQCKVEWPVYHRLLNTSPAIHKKTANPSGCESTSSDGGDASCQDREVYMKDPINSGRSSNHHSSSSTDTLTNELLSDFLRRKFQRKKIHIHINDATDNHVTQAQNCDDEDSPMGCFCDCDSEDSDDDDDDEDDEDYDFEKDKNREYSDGYDESDSYNGGSELSDAGDSKSDWNLCEGDEAVIAHRHCASAACSHLQSHYPLERSQSLPRLVGRMKSFNEMPRLEDGEHSMQDQTEKEDDPDAMEDELASGVEKLSVEPKS